MLALGVAKLRGGGGCSPPEWVLPGRIGCWAHSAAEKPQFTDRGCRGVARSVEIARSCISVLWMGQLEVLGVPEPAVSPRQWHHGHLLMKTLHLANVRNKIEI